MNIVRSIRHYYYGLLIMDLLVWVFAFVCSYWIRHFNEFPNIPQNYLIVIPYVLIVYAFVFRYFGLYRGEPKRTGQFFYQFFQLVKAEFVGLGILLALSFFYRGFSYSRIMVVSFFTVAFCLNLLVRHIYQLAVKEVLKSIRWQHRILIVGGGEVGKKLIEEFFNHTTEYHVIGFLDDMESLQRTYYHGVPCLGKVSDLKVIVDRNKIDEMIIAFPSASYSLYRDIIKLCTETDIKYRFVPKMFNVVVQDISVDTLDGIPLIGIKGNNLTGFNYVIKRTLDIIVSSLLIIIFAPLMIVVAVLIKIFSPGPILYTQERIGYNKQAFKFYKFRSMHHHSDDSIHKEYINKWIGSNKESEIKDGNTTVHKIANDPRIIPFIGKIIRKYSIDELTQLFNVLKGDMSLVGPRPCLRYEMEEYKTWHKARFDALPGITGLWQVSGRNRLSFDDMVRMDINYLQNWSLEKDLYIILKTPFVVLFGKAY